METARPEQRAQEREQHPPSGERHRDRDAAGGGIKMPLAAPDAPVANGLTTPKPDWDALRAAYPRDAECEAGHVRRQRHRKTGIVCRQGGFCVGVISLGRSELCRHRI